MKAKALLEVVIVFGLTLFLVVLVGRSPLGAWERRVLQRNYIEYIVMIALPLLILVATRRNLAAYGLTLRNLRYQLDITATALIPMAISFFPAAFFDWRQWDGALIMAAVQIVLLFTLGWLLKRKPTWHESGLMASAFLLVAWTNRSQQVSLGNALSAFIFYIFFLGFGEELLFRGYIQSRLNEAWGRPYQFYGVNWGWGLVIASVLFAMMHVINAGGLVINSWQPEWWWGLWTLFGGLVFGFVREKTGSIVAPVLLHGLPQGFYAAYTGT